MEHLYDIRQAPGADSGARGEIFCVDFEAIKAELEPNQALFYDFEKLMVSLQGLLNRERPVIYVADADGELWFRYFRRDFDGLLYGYRSVQLASREDFIRRFLPVIRELGLVVWDPKLPATSNIASTVCGVEGFLPVMHSDDSESLYRILTDRYGVPVKLDLRGKFTGAGNIWDADMPSSGSAKCDAYLWAMEKYLKTGKTGSEYIAYMKDAYPVNGDLRNPKYIWECIYETYLPDQDFLIMKKAFFVDLCPFPDDLPNDDLGQEMGTDYRTLCCILRAHYERNDGAFSQAVGFAPFLYKYTDRVGGKYDDVMAEWQVVEVMSAYNIALQADCPGPSSIHNCSVYSHYPLKARYSQQRKRPKSLPDYDPSKKYITFYLGDYDAASWSLSLGIKRWLDPKRGQVPLAWAFNPNLCHRIPQLFDYVHQTASDSDVFVAGDSGAGYINPPLLEEGRRKHSNLPDGLSAWQKFCLEYYCKFDISLTPFILQGNTGYPNDKVMAAHKAFSPDGCAVWSYPGDYYGMRLIDGMPVIGMPQDEFVSQSGTVEQAASEIVRAVQNKRKLPFYQIKTNIIAPSLLADALTLAKERDPDIVALDIFTFYAMIKREMEKDPDTFGPQHTEAADTPCILDKATC